jgi:hypothetical protein
MRGSTTSSASERATWSKAASAIGSRRLSEAISAIAGTEGAAAEALSRSAGRRLAAPGHQEERQPLVDAATGDDADGAFFQILEAVDLGNAVRCDPNAARGSRPVE